MMTGITQGAAARAGAGVAIAAVPITAAAAKVDSVFNVTSLFW
jgi:hypothetical protein